MQVTVMIGIRAMKTYEPTASIVQSLIQIYQIIKRQFKYFVIILYKNSFQKMNEKLKEFTNSKSFQFVGFGLTSVESILIQHFFKISFIGLASLFLIAFLQKIAISSFISSLHLSLICILPFLCLFFPLQLLFSVLILPQCWLQLQSLFLHLGLFLFLFLYLDFKILDLSIKLMLQYSISSNHIQNFLLFLHQFPFERPNLPCKLVISQILFSMLFILILSLASSFFKLLIMSFFLFHNCCLVIVFLILCKFKIVVKRFLYFVLLLSCQFCDLTLTFIKLFNQSAHSFLKIFIFIQKLSNFFFQQFFLFQILNLFKLLLFLNIFFELLIFFSKQILIFIPFFFKADNFIPPIAFLSHEETFEIFVFLLHIFDYACLFLILLSEQLVLLLEYLYFPDQFFAHVLGYFQHLHVGLNVLNVLLLLGAESNRLLVLNLRLSSRMSQWLLADVVLFLRLQLQ